jgi:hypothetical protein
MHLQKELVAGRFSKHIVDNIGIYDQLHEVIDILQEK